MITYRDDGKVERYEGEAATEDRQTECAHCGQWFRIDFQRTLQAQSFCGLCEEWADALDAANARVAAMTAERDEAREYAKACNEVRDLIDKNLAAAPGLPMEMLTTQELEQWTDAVTTILKNIGLWQVAEDAYPLTKAAIATSPSSEG